MGVCVLRSFSPTKAGVDDAEFGVTEDLGVPLLLELFRTLLLRIRFSTATASGCCCIFRGELKFTSDLEVDDSEAAFIFCRVNDDTPTSDLDELLDCGDGDRRNEDWDWGDMGFELWNDLFGCSCSTGDFSLSRKLANEVLWLLHSFARSCCGFSWFAL